MEMATLDELLHSEPFTPFRLKFTNGERLDVHNPSLVVPMKRHLFVADAKREGFHFYSLLHIVSAESISNGSHKRRS